MERMGSYSHLMQGLQPSSGQPYDYMLKKPYRSNDIVNLLNLLKPKIVGKPGKKQMELLPVFEIALKATPSVASQQT